MNTTMEKSEMMENEIICEWGGLSQQKLRQPSYRCRAVTAVHGHTIQRVNDFWPDRVRGSDDLRPGLARGSAETGQKFM